MNPWPSACVTLSCVESSVFSIQELRERHSMQSQAVVTAPPGATVPTDVVIETRNLTKVYRDFWGRQKVRRLKALDLEVRRGEIFGLLGPTARARRPRSSCCWACCSPPAAQALVFGRDATDVTKNERIGYLPEESYLYRFLNAEETLDFYGRLFNMPRRASAASGRRPDRSGRPGVGQAAAVERILQGHDPPHRPGPGPDQRSRTDRARRADHRLDPIGTPRDEGPDPQAPRRRARRS